MTSLIYAPVSPECWRRHFYLYFFFFLLFSIHFHLESHLLRRDSVMTVQFLLPYSCMYIGLLHSVLDTVEQVTFEYFSTHIFSLRCLTILNYFNNVPVVKGRDSSVGIANRYGLGGPGIESWWERDFPHPSRPHRLLYSGYRVSFPRVKRLCFDVNNPHPLARLKKE